MTQQASTDRIDCLNQSGQIGRRVSVTWLTAKRSFQLGVHPCNTCCHRQQCSGQK